MKLNRILVLSGLLITMALPVFAQMMQPIGPEIKGLGRFVGEWSTEDTTVGMDGKKVVGKGKCFFKWACGGRYLQSSMGTTAADMGKIEGVMMLTYDPVLKQYVSTWFDSAAAHSMRSIGTFEKGKLDLLSDEFEEGGMGKMRIRSTYTFDGANTLRFSLKMINAQGEQEWMTSVWKRKSARR